VPPQIKFEVSNANILVAEDFGLHNVLFFSDRNVKGQHFTFNNTVVNGVAFWTLAQEGGEINFQNAQGCTQIIADKIALDDVRFSNCFFGQVTNGNGEVPEPSVAVLLGVALAALAAYRSRRRPAGSAS
jgi:hypothetical protein